MPKTYQQLVEDYKQGKGFGSNAGHESLDKLLKTLHQAKQNLEAKNDPAYDNMIAQFGEYYDAMSTLEYDHDAGDYAAEGSWALTKLAGLQEFFKQTTPYGEKTCYEVFMDAAEETKNYNNRKEIEQGLDLLAEYGGANLDQEELKWQADPKRTKTASFAARYSEDPGVKGKMDELYAKLQAMELDLDKKGLEGKPEVEKTMAVKALKSMTQELKLGAKTMLGEPLSSDGITRIPPGHMTLVDAKLNTLGNQVEEFEKGGKKNQVPGVSKDKTLVEAIGDEEVAKLYNEIAEAMQPGIMGAGLLQDALYKETDIRPAKNYDEYLEQHTGAVPPSMQYDVLAKAMAATLLKDKNERFDEKEIEKRAKEIKAQPAYSALFADEDTCKRVAQNLTTGNISQSIKDMASPYATSTYEARADCIQEVKEMGGLLYNATNRSDKWTELCESVKNLDPNADEAEQGKQYDKVFDDIEKYMKGKKRVRSSDDGNYRFEQTLDLLAAASKISPVAEAKAQAIVDRINEVREKHGEPPVSLGGRNAETMRQRKEAYELTHAPTQREPAPERKSAPTAEAGDRISMLSADSVLG